MRKIFSSLADGALVVLTAFQLLSLSGCLLPNPGFFLGGDTEGDNPTTDSPTTGPTGETGSTGANPTMGSTGSTGDSTSDDDPTDGSSTGTTDGSTGGPDVPTTGGPGSSGDSTGMVDVCGDGGQGPTEACDDGNQDNSDACIDCQHAYCGDGFIWEKDLPPGQPPELCDKENVGTESCEGLYPDLFKGGVLSCVLMCDAYNVVGCIPNGAPLTCEGTQCELGNMLKADMPLPPELEGRLDCNADFTHCTVLPDPTKG